MTGLVLSRGLHRFDEREEQLARMISSTLRPSGVYSGHARLGGMFGTIDLHRVLLHLSFAKVSVKLARLIHLTVRSYCGSLGVRVSQETSRRAHTTGWQPYS